MSGEEIEDCLSYVKKLEKAHRHSSGTDSDDSSSTSSGDVSSASQDSDRKSKKKEKAAAKKTPEVWRSRDRNPTSYRPRFQDQRNKPRVVDPARGVCGRCGKLGHQAAGCTAPLHAQAKEGDHQALLQAIRNGTVQRPTA